MRTRHLAPLALLLVLTACDGGGGPGDGDLNRAASGTLSLRAGANGTLVPGQLVRLTAEIDGDADGVTVTWAQTSGPDVDLEDADKMVARGVQELFVTGADGSGNLRASGALVPAGDVQGAEWSPGGVYIAYTATQLAADRIELFVSTADGSDNRRVSLTATQPGQVVFDFDRAPDSSRIAYRGDVDTDDVIELFTVRPDGSSNARVSAVSGNGDVSTFFAPFFSWAPDSTAIAYIANQIVDDALELFVSGADGTGNRRVSAPLVATGQVRRFLWSPDGSRLAYHADQNVVNDLDLFVASPDGSTVVQVSGPLVADGDVLSDYAWAPDRQWLAYRGNQTDRDVIELYAATPDGAAFMWSADSARLVYAADQFVDNTFELFVAAPDGSAPNNRLSGDLTTGGDVLRFNTGL